jgi:4a-hydroxytetrahydrobiopterin dehydratase
MNQACSLTDKKCIPCEGGVPPLSHEEIENLLKEVSQWTIIDNKQLERDFKFKNFKEAIEFVNKVANLAESEQHHPDIFLHGWNKVKLTLSTHAIGGLSENDFILAAKINTITQ